VGSSAKATQRGPAVRNDGPPFSFSFVDTLHRDHEVIASIKDLITSTGEGRMLPYIDIRELLE